MKPKYFRGGKEKFKSHNIKIYGGLEFFYLSDFYFNILGRKNWFLEIRNERLIKRKMMIKEK